MQRHTTIRHDCYLVHYALVQIVRNEEDLPLEGIAYRSGWISEERMREIAKPMLKNQYGQYLLKVIDEMREETNSNFFRDKGLERQATE